eukprot:Sspe_Gene.117219::Locus_107970_Transcript_1_1_Confidence_1.000_Length_405::g.117219::m.117219
MLVLDPVYLFGAFRSVAMASSCLLHHPLPKYAFSVCGTAACAATAPSLLPSLFPSTASHEGKERATQPRALTLPLPFDVLFTHPCAQPTRLLLWATLAPPPPPPP